MLLLGLTAMVLGQTGPVVVRRKDPITDQAAVVAAWEANGSAIAVGCTPATNTIRVIYMAERHYFGRTGLLTSAWGLTYRFDESEPVSQDWLHDDHTAEMSGSGRIAPFIDKLATSKRLVIRAKENFGRGDSFDAIFDLGDALPALKEVLRECRTNKIVGKLTVKFGL
jgi:hypothetical protein